MRAQSKSQKDVIYLRADETVPFGTFSSVIDTLRQSGISNISIVTEPMSDRARLVTMAYAIRNSNCATDIRFKPFLTYSVLFHMGLTIALLLGVYFQRTAPMGRRWWRRFQCQSKSRRQSGIPMPQPTVATESATVDPTKGLHKEEPKKPPEPKTDSTKIPKFDKLKPPPPTKASKTFENKTPPPDNAVNYGKGGTMSVPSGYNNTPGPLNGGMAIQGQGGGEFASRYPWYVESVRKRRCRELDSEHHRPARSSRAQGQDRRHLYHYARWHHQERPYRHVLRQSLHGRLCRSRHAQHRESRRAPADWRGNSVDVIFDFDLGLYH